MMNKLESLDSWIIITLINLGILPGIILLCLAATSVLLVWRISRLSPPLKAQRHKGT